MEVSVVGHMEGSSGGHGVESVRRVTNLCGLSFTVLTHASLLFRIAPLFNRPVDSGLSRSTNPTAKLTRSFGYSGLYYFRLGTFITGFWRLFEALTCARILHKL